MNNAEEKNHKCTNVLYSFLEKHRDCYIKISK